MGTKFCSECTGYQQQVIITKQTLYDKDQPNSSYARCQAVHFDVNCATNHIFTEKENSEIAIDPEIQRGKLDKRSYLILAHNVYYTGEWKEGFPHGLGEIVFQNGSILKSTFINGKAKGTDSILAMDDGSYYRGNIDNNSLNGKGIFKQKNGHYYEGEWQNNVPHGKGIQRFQNGDIYEGQYNKGIKNGVGRYKWNNDSEFIEYNGQFDNDYMKGQGTLITKDCKIIGVFHENSIQDARFSQGSLDFRGSVVNGTLNGYGKIVNSVQRSTYEGSFENGQPNGKGTLTLQNGEIKKGFWIQGRYIKQHLGISIQNLGKCLDMIQEQLEERQYEQEVIQELKRRLQEGGFENLHIQITGQPQLNRKSKKYLIVEIGEKWLQISED